MTVAGSALCGTAAAIDWRQPWFAQYHEHGPAVTASLRAMFPHACVADALNRRRASPMRFVEASRLPAGEPYETFINSTLGIPTRDNLHDLFNGLVWLTFPLSKRRLNVLQADAIRAAGIGATRGPLRDAITLFDENGALLLHASAPLLDALAARDWRRAFIALRAHWSDARLVPFGHALLEKLVQPRKDICAHVLPLSVEGKTVAPDRLDAALAERLQPELLAAKPFLPLPVLGVPAWSPDNEHPAFYDDATVFRPRRQSA